MSRSNALLLILGSWITFTLTSSPSWAQSVCTLPSFLTEGSGATGSWGPSSSALFENRELSSYYFQKDSSDRWSILRAGQIEWKNRQFVAVLPPGYGCYTQFRNWTVTEERLVFRGRSLWRSENWVLTLRVVLAHGELNTFRKFRGKWLAQRGNYIGYLTVIPELESRGPRGRPVPRPDFFAEVRVLGIYNSASSVVPLATADLLVTFVQSGERSSRLVQVKGNGEISILESVQQ